VKKLLIPLGIAFATAASFAWAKAPADATGECKDGTYTTSASKEGACSSHGGVKKWMAKEDKSAAKGEKSEKSGKSEKSTKSAKSEAATAKAEKPANATGECKDGTYTDAATKSGACSGHKGVKTWYGAKEGASPSSSGSMGSTGSTSSKTSSATPKSGSSSSMGSTSSMGSASGSSSMPSSSSSSASKSASTPAAERTAAAGGGAGKVWVNTDSKVYHCQADALYGKTKQGEYMSESQAKASGARAARGKECS